MASETMFSHEGAWGIFQLFFSALMLCLCVCVSEPALWVVHEEQVEQSVSSIRQPGEFILQVVVRLLSQTVLTNKRQLRETLGKTDTHTHTHKLNMAYSLADSTDRELYLTPGTKRCRAS